MNTAERIITRLINDNGSGNSEPAYLSEPPIWVDAENMPVRKEPVIHLAYEALEPLEPRQQRVAGLISEGDVILFFGAPGTKKTILLMDMAVAIVTGQKWLRLDTFRCPVLIIDEESGDHRMKKRIGSIMRARSAEADIELFWTTLEGFSAREPADLMAIENAIIRTRAGFVIVDALADIALGADENSVRDMQPVFHGLRQIAERTRAAIAMIHHANKTGGYRGSSAILGAVDLALLVESKEDSPTVDITTAKARDISFVKLAANITFEPDWIGVSNAPIKDAVKHLSKSEEYVLRFLRAHGESLRSEIMKHADTCSDTAARQAIYTLVVKGMVMRVDDGGPGEAATFGLTPFQEDEDHLKPPV